MPHDKEKSSLNQGRRLESGQLQAALSPDVHQVEACQNQSGKEQTDDRAQL